jgi:hypothetical protein
MIRASSHAFPKQWLATASGLLNPLVPMELAINWVRIVARLIDEAANASGSTEPILLAGNPVILTPASEIVSSVGDHLGHRPGFAPAGASPGRCR